MKRAGVTLAGLVAALVSTTSLVPAQAADAILSGTVAGAAGDKMGGVTVSARADGSTITTSVFTDEAGGYYFPPLPAGHYRVWAQALSFATANAQVDLKDNAAQNFTLSPLKDYVRQLPGDVLMAALPEETDHDKKMKQLVRNDCTGCHSPSYTLQHRFDEAGWTAVIDLMKMVNVSGIYQGEKAKPNALLEYNKKDLAAYLARARGPGESSMKITLPPRPSGEAARVVFREYNVPPEPDNSPVRSNDGHDWSLGTPSKIGSLVHDAWSDLDGNLWFTSNVPNKVVTVGRIDTKTGAVKFLKVPNANGLAANTHGMFRDKDGNLWFNINTGKGGLGKLDPKTEKIAVYTPPQGMSPTGGAVTVDVDGKGFIWASSPVGALRFDPKTETFTEFKSITPETPNGSGLTYGAAADRDGNGWWAEMQIDIVGHADPASGKVTEIKLPVVEDERARASADEKKFYDGFRAPDFNAPVPWSQGPRRMGTDKNADVLWVGNSWGHSLARIDTKTKEVSFVPLPGTMQPYHIAVDSDHNAWLNVWVADSILRYDPSSKTWTRFDLPTRGSEARYISVTEHTGARQVVVPYYRASKVALMSFRSEADLAALKAQAAK
ncbi:MAG TPA: carboxypeptidase regulatory-like domain-containing protein [Xanthobacteraceae bacterium]|nr:carboxypeptidase regulatory-like domain-containing protein [Xanthobacteraceae bacterium]